jgi:hypothetical protein
MHSVVRRINDQAFLPKPRYPIDKGTTIVLFVLLDWPSSASDFKKERTEGGDVGCRSRLVIANEGDVLPSLQKTV